jgi:ATP-dependent DNA helicase RecQ
LQSESKKDIRTWIEQLTGQGFLAKTGEYNVLQITDYGRELLRGNAEPRLTCPTVEAPKAPKSSHATSWEGVDSELFEKLRTLRTGEASRQQIPAYVVFSDASLRDMARRRPSTLENFRLVHGVGQKKLDDYGELFLDLIQQHCESANLETDVQPSVSNALIDTVPRTAKKPAGKTAAALAAFDCFDQSMPLDEIAEKIGRAVSTTRGYLIQYIRQNNITDAGRWVQPDVMARISAAASQVGIEGLKPIYVALEEEIGYDDISVVVACLKNVPAE